MKKTVIFIAILVGVIYFLGWHLQPLEARFFSFHDDTQVGRMKEFAFALSTFQIPPRLAPHFSFGMGFPVFNFYAPFSYWVGGLLTVIGIPVVVAAKLSFFLALIIMFIGMYLLISALFSFEAALVAATVYTSSTWIATEIFARGNIGELWFIALLPLALFMLKKNSTSQSIFTFIGTILILTFTLTSHNVLSLVGLLFIGVYIIFIPQYKKNTLALLLALLISAYYFLPLIGESALTYAKAQAERTPYIDHFLCVSQLWTSPNWELGGSGPSCNDGMSFKLGKIQLILGIIGFGLWLIQHDFKKNKELISITFVGIISLFMMLPISLPIWHLFSFALAAFQFPWRFNSFFLFFIAVFAGYSVFLMKKWHILNKISAPIIYVLICAMLISSRPYFRHPWRLSYSEYYLKYVSDEYISKNIAYAIPEYLPRTASYEKWFEYRKINKGNEYLPFIGNNHNIEVQKNFPYNKSMKSLKNQTIIINNTYFPFWEINIDGIKVAPKLYDELGRPIISNLKKGSILTVRYNETPIEKAGNTITVITFITLLTFIFNKKLWKKLTNTLQ